MKNLKQLLMKKKCKQMKETIRNIKTRDEFSENNRGIRENNGNP